jgi:two-component system, chemotaxis family, CheB/CheR fusion protein
MVGENTQRSRETSPEARRRVRILVVDDYVDNVESMAMVLRLFDHDVETALGGKDALEVARTRRPDIVLLDISMPGMDGFELARRLRAMFHNEIAIVAVTAYGLEENEDRYRAAGIDRHLVKPADPSEVDKVVREYADAH